MEKSFPSKDPAKYTPGDTFLLDNKLWVVYEYSELSPSGEYMERQWTVQAASGRENAYLMHCIGERSGIEIEQWFFSRPIELKMLELEGGGSLNEKMSAYPQPSVQVRYGGRTFSLKETYTVKAVDDEGQTVPRETRDYFDASGKDNLAMEIWHEPDAYYPEAYLGRRIDPQELVYQARQRVFTKDVKKYISYIVFAPFVLLTARIPLDYILLLSFLFTAMVWAYLLSRNSCFVVGVFSALVGGVLIMLLGSLSGWFTAITIVLLATAMTRVMAAMAESLAVDIAQVSSLTAFCSALLVSFYIYFHFAPGPHTAFQLGEAAVIPFLIAGVTYLINWGVDRVCPNTD